MCIICIIGNIRAVMRGEERFREDGETAQEIAGGGRKDAKKIGDGRTSMKREKGDYVLKNVT